MSFRPGRRGGSWRCGAPELVMARFQCCRANLTLSAKIRTPNLKRELIIGRSCYIVEWNAKAGAAGVSVRSAKSEAAA